MSYDDDDFANLVRRLSQAPAMNGGFDKLRSDVTDLEGDIKQIRQTLCEQERSLSAIDLKLGAVIKLGWIVVGAIVAALAKEFIGLL